MPPNKTLTKKSQRTHALTLLAITQALLVEEYLSFRRAAHASGVQQSVMSRRVRDLEDELGVSIFERHRAGVRVTNAGALFLQDAREALRQLDRAVESATAAGSGTVGGLSIGILSSMTTGYLRELIQVYCSRHPGISLQILERPPADIVTAVRKRQLDIAFIIDASDAKGCETLPLWDEKIFVVLGHDHALCAKKEITWADLRGEHLIVRESERDPKLCERVREQLTDVTHQPNVQTLKVSRETLMNLVAMGLGVGLTSEATVATPFRNVLFRPIGDDDAQLQFSAIWLPQNDNPALRRLLSLARTLAKDRQRRAGPPIGRSSFEPPVMAGISFFLASLGALSRRLGLST